MLFGPAEKYHLGNNGSQCKVLWWHYHACTGRCLEEVAKGTHRVVLQLVGASGPWRTDSDNLQHAVGQKELAPLSSHPAIGLVRRQTLVLIPLMETASQEDAEPGEKGARQGAVAEPREVNQPTHCPASHPQRQSWPAHSLGDRKVSKAGCQVAFIWDQASFMVICALCLEDTTTRPSPI